MTADSANTLLQYSALRESLARAGSVVALAELHGGICGALCAGAASAAERWLEDCFADQQVATTVDVRDAVQELLRASWQMLEGDELAFEPLLPDDDEPLEEQVQALALWCHGFLGGLGASAPDIRNGLEATRRSDGAAPLEIEEVLGDFVEISRAGLSEDEAAGHDQPDFALAEIKEYVRISAQLVFEDLAPRRAAAARGVH